MVYAFRKQQRGMSWLRAAVCSHSARFGSCEGVEEPHGLTEPRPFLAAQIAGQRDLLVEDTLRPFSRLLVTPLLGQECGIVELSLRQGGAVERLAEKPLGLLALPRAGIAICQQPGGTLVVELAVEAHHLFEVPGRGREIVQVKFHDSASIERVRHIGARRDGFVETLACAVEFFFFAVKIGEFLVIARGGIIEHDNLEVLDALSPRIPAEAFARDLKIGKNFYYQIDCGAQRPEGDDDPKPVHVRPAANEIYDGRSLKDQGKNDDESPHFPRTIAQPVAASAYRFGW
jgi:hypothetical protein